MHFLEDRELDGIAVEVLEELQAVQTMHPMRISFGMKDTIGIEFLL